MRRSWALVAMGMMFLPALAWGGEASLFVPDGVEWDRAAVHGVGVMRARTVGFNASALPGADGASLLPPVGHTILLNLFDDVTLRARLVRAERIQKGMTWVGRLPDQPLSDVVLTVYDGILTGSVTWPDASYRITVEGGRTVVQQLDHSQFPENGCFEEVPGGALDVPARPEAATDDGSFVDVVVVYTPAARAAYGGTSAILSAINTAVTETNTGYANSGVIQRVRLAAAQEISYTESGTTTTSMRTDLDRVTGTSDGYMDTVHSLRDTYHADLVSLFVTGYNNQYGACGIAWLMPGNYPSFATNAFSVVDIECATGYYSFGHEMGHNMGLNHARVDPVGTGAYSYSYGYKWTGYRTVMAYLPGTRILYFSNPNVSYIGNPTGINEAAADSANNALSLNNTRVTVANWRVAPVRQQPVWHSWFAVDTLETPYVGDFNGDSKTDIITFTRQNPSAIGDVYVALSDGTKFGTNTKWNDWFAITTDETVVIGDYDNDGKDDIATWLGKTTRQVYVARSTGTGMTTATVWLSGIGFDSSDVPLSGDVNNDGKKDLILFARTQGKVYVALSDGTKFGTPTEWHAFFAVSTYERPRVADVDGDGRADIVTFATDSPTAYGDVYVALSNGTRFVNRSGVANSSDKWHDWFAIRSTEQVRVGDLNGDGKDDFYTFLPPPYAQCYTVLSQGSSMAANVLWPEAVRTDAKDVPFVGDANGDGKADIILFAQGEGKVYVSLAQ